MASSERKTAKKRLIIAFAIILAALLLLYGATLLIQYLGKDISNSADETEYIADFNFYPADYSENIFDDPEYLSLIQNGTLLYDNNSNFATVVNKDNADEFGEGVVLLVDMVDAIINGDPEKYNSYFSQKYFDSHEPKENFTMQKVYNAKLTYLSSEEETVDGVVCKKQVYTLVYNIYENNGTFRKDIGEGARAQSITVSNREGKMLIDNIQYVKYIGYYG